MRNLLMEEIDMRTRDLYIHLSAGRIKMKAVDYQFLSHKYPVFFFSFVPRR
jgi:hypothetical protein